MLHRAISAAAAVLVAATAVSAASSAAQEPPRERVSTATYATLARDGEIVVVVSLRQPRESLGAQERREQIASRQQRVLDGLGSEGYQVRHRYRAFAGMALVVDSVEVLDRLAVLPGIRRADVDVGGHGALADSVPLVNANLAHDAGFKGKAAKVVVIDSGIDTNHRDLRRSLVDEACICNTGVNCCPKGGSFGTGKGSAEDDQGHGTHVSGIITSDGKKASVGVAPKADVVAVKVLDSNNAFSSSSDIVAALDWVLANHPDAAAVNMSLGTNALFGGNCDKAASWTQVLANAVNALARAGIIVVSSAANDGNTSAMSAPACLRKSLSVGATSKADTVAAFSNSSKRLDVFAPGVAIVSSGLGGQTRTMSGTSMAAPHVAGAAALWAEAQGSRLPMEFRAKKFKSCLRKSKVKITDPRSGLRRGRLDVAQLLECGGADLS